MLKWLHEQFLLSRFFIMIIIFSRNMLFTKVVANFHICFVLEFHDFSPANLRVIDFVNFQSVSVLLYV
jgi:hypothetical protein